MNRPLHRWFAGTLLAASAFAATAQSWHALGPESGNVSVLLADPGIAGRVYAAGAGGLFRSDDAGSLWNAIGASPAGGLPPGIQRLIADADQPGRLYAATSTSIFRSDDYAQTWAATGYVVPLNDWINSIADIPGSSNALLMTLGSGYVRKSTDAGTSFSALVTGLPADRSLYVVAADPANGSHLLAGVGYNGSSSSAPALFSSVDGGQSWSGMDIRPGAGQVWQLKFMSSNRVVAVIDGALYLSVDNAQTWNLLPQYSLDAIVELPGETAGMLISNPNECHLTHDNFSTSLPCSEGLPYQGIPSASVFGIAVTGLPGGGYRLLVGGNRYGIYVSNNASLPWVWSNAGMHSNQTRGVVVHPRDTSRIYAGMSDFLDRQFALVQTPDNGTQWLGYLHDQARFIRTIALDPTTAGAPFTTNLYAGGSSSRISGQPTNSGMYKSVDGGVNWTALNDGLPPSTSPTFPGGVNFGTVRDLVLDPRSCANPPANGICSSGPLNTVYAVANATSTLVAAESFRIVKSVQGGANWVALGADLPLAITGDNHYEYISPVSLVLDAQSSSTLYVGTFGIYEDDNGAPVTPTIANGVFRSTDGGLHWEHRSSGLPRVAGSADTGFDVFALAAHPRKSGVLWASTVLTGQASRIYKSIDGGASWLTSGPTLPNCDVRDLIVDTSAPDIVYAVGLSVAPAEGCVYRSEDAGANWTALHAGLRANSALSIARDPQNQTRLIVAANSGVWELIAAPDRIFDDRE